MPRIEVVGERMLKNEVRKMKEKEIVRIVQEVLDKRFAYKTLGNGRKLVTAAGTPERLSDQDIPCAGVNIQALSGNTGLMYWGCEEKSAVAALGFELDIGAEKTIPVDNLNKIWIDAATSGEGVCWAILK